MRYVASAREREMFVLRVLDGWTLKEIADHFGIGRERVRQLLRLYCGLTGTPPAAVARRRAREVAARSARHAAS